MGGDTRFPYLSFSIYDRGWGCSWNDRGVAIPPMHDERQIFERLFGEEDLSAKRNRSRTTSRSVQSLYRDMEQIKKKGGDASKIESYRTVISELEAQLKHEEFWLKTKKPEVPNTLSDDQEFAFSTKVRNLFELSKLALQTDSTRGHYALSSIGFMARSKSPAQPVAGTLSRTTEARLMRSENSAGIEVDIVKHLDRFLAELDQVGRRRGEFAGQYHRGDRE